MPWKRPASSSSRKMVAAPACGSRSESSARSEVGGLILALNVRTKMGEGRSAASQKKQSSILASRRSLTIPQVRKSPRTRH
jgi:hypothetical protein